MEIYINSAGIISGSGNNKTGSFIPEMTTSATMMLTAKEPDYTADIPPMQLRRMSKAVRMGIAASKTAMSAEGLGKPGAISVGTAMGCLYDTEVFLLKMIDQDEQMLTPTSFIQSTHNTVAGQIALLAGCHGHNLTYTHRGHSFEHALINAQLYLDEHPQENVLVGGIDELANTSFEVLKAAGLYRSEPMIPADILSTYGEGSLAGEGAAFFMVSRSPLPGKYIRVSEVSAFSEKDGNVALGMVMDFLFRNQLTADNIDLVVFGMNGDSRNRHLYEKLSKTVFENNSQAAFKHLSGEYGTAAAFAIAMVYESVVNGGVPGVALLGKAPEKLGSILVISNYLHYYSLWHLTV